MWNERLRPRKGKVDKMPSWLKSGGSKGRGPGGSRKNSPAAKGGGGSFSGSRPTSYGPSPDYDDDDGCSGASSGGSSNSGRSPDYDDDDD